jgi:hypothetical protein
MKTDQLYDWCGDLISFDGGFLVRLIATDNYLGFGVQFQLDNNISSFTKIDIHQLPLYINKKYKSQEFLDFFK